MAKSIAVQEQPVDGVTTADIHGSRAGLGDIDCRGDVILTQQQFKDDADLNVMLRRYGVTGQMSSANGQPMYGDFSDVGDYLQAQQVVAGVDAHFATLPALVRDRFKNNPAELLSFVADDKNRDEAIKLGLIPAPVPAPGSDVPPAK